MEDRLDDLLLRWEELAEAGQDVSAAELCRDCPQLGEELERRIQALRRANCLSALHQPLPPASPLILLAPDSEPVPGYRLGRRLGRGGFSEVWEAAGPAGPLALKFVPQTERAARVEWRSVEVLRHIQHPNLLRTYGTWITPDFLVIGMELADRTLLDRWQEARGAGGQGIPRDELLGYLRDAAEGVDYLQKRYIQHRDVKPQNLLLVGGRVKVGDFGLARLLANSVTGHTGSLTLAYAAPEFFEGRTTRHSDQYSLAVSYCQMRGGRLPFEGTPAAMVAAHLHRPPDLSMLPAEERPPVAKALAKRPGDRWPTCRAFVAAVADPRAAPRDVGGPAARRRRRRWPWAVAAVAALALALLTLLPKRPPAVTVRAFKKVDDAGLVRSVAVSRVLPPLDRVVALSNGSTCPVVWDVSTGKPLHRLPYAGGACAALAPLELPLGLTGHDDGVMVLWDLNTGREVRRLVGHTDSVSGVAFSPDASQALSGACDGTVRLWDRRTGREVRCLRGHQGFVSSVAFDPTGRRGLSGGWDGTVRLWDLDAGAELKRFPGHASGVQSVAFSPDGRQAVSGGSDRTVRLWDVESGREVRRIEGQFETICFVRFSGFDRVLAADGPAVRLLDARDGHDLLHIPRQRSTVLSAGLVRAGGREYVILGTERDGAWACELP